MRRSDYQEYLDTEPYTCAEAREFSEVVFSSATPWTQVTACPNSLAEGGADARYRISQPPDHEFGQQPHHPNPARSTRRSRCACVVVPHEHVSEQKVALPERRRAQLWAPAPAPARASQWVDDSEWLPRHCSVGVSQSISFEKSRSKLPSCGWMVMAVFAS